MARVWTPVYKQIAQNSDKTCAELVQRFLPLLTEADDAFAANDMTKVAKAFKDGTGLAFKMIPHIKDKKVVHDVVDHVVGGLLG